MGILLSLGLLLTSLNTMVEGPRLVCEKPVHDFDRRWAGEDVRHRFEIVNRGTSTLKLKKAGSGCSCIRVEDWDREIAPGETGYIEAVLITEKLKGGIKKRLQVATNDPEHKVVPLFFEGLVVRAVALEPPAGLNWGRRNKGTVLKKTVRLINNTAKPMRLEPVPAHPDVVSVFDASIREIEPGNVYEVEVTAKEPFREGLNFMRLRFSTGLEEAAHVEIPCRLFEPPLVEVKPPALLFTRALPKAFRRTIRVDYAGEGVMELRSAVPTHDEVKVEVKPARPGKGWILEVVVPKGFKPASDEEAAIVLETDVKGRERVEIPIRVGSSSR